jgi:GNAT superfamily N-acetyltransferase
VGLVDLRGRTSDADVQALVARVSYRAEGVTVPPLLGWSVDDELVGCLGVERGDDRELELRDVFVLEEHRLQGIGRALVEAVVAGAPVERFRVDCDAEVAGFFERCGFVLESGCSYIRRVAATPGKDDAIAAARLADLESAIRASWSRETSADPDEWAEENPARGQCDATAVVLRMYLGGEILVADVLRDGQRLERHAWNRLPSGLTLDLTRDQFRAGEQLGEPVAQEPLLLGNASGRHTLLAQRVAAALVRGA